ncbi:MAG: hypothetical protein EBU66_11780, partial [Bacteroidetes bacterium]|nr:hypothetical protein [Bacteroidota bacterium]
MTSKNRTNKRKSRKLLKARSRKQRGAGGGISKPASINAPPPIKSSNGQILPEDILYQDADVCILKPNIKKGVLIFTNYEQPADMPPICEAGLKTGAQLKREGVDFGRIMIHDYIFFRAPYLSNLIDYRSIDTEIASSFGDGESSRSSRVWIRIDPENSNVYSSELRAKFSPKFRYGSPEYLSAIERQVNMSKKSMTEYLRILGENEMATTDIEPGKKPLYNLLSSKVHLVPWNSRNIKKNSKKLRFHRYSRKINTNSEKLDFFW